MSLRNEIIQWLEGFDYWFQYAGEKFLNGESITEPLVDKVYELFLEDNSLKPKSEREKIVIRKDEIDTSDGLDNLKLEMIKNISNVNALADKQSIKLSPKLTIIFGNNGAGKSGYIRLLNNAFNSRGDKRLIKNVFDKAVMGEPSCEFTYEAGNKSYDLSYPSQKDKAEFSKYCVFDSYSIRIHLEQDNKLNFTPKGFDFFEKVEKLFEQIRGRINQAIKDKRIANDIVRFFNNDNDIKTQVAILDSTTKIAEIKKLADYTEQDESILQETKNKIQEFKALDIPKKITELTQLIQQSEDFLLKQQNIINCLTEPEIQSYIDLINNYKQLHALSTEEGVKSFEHYKIEGIGSKEWREFIKSARSYSVSLDQIRLDGNSYPSDGDSCLFCMQPINEKEDELIKSYWKFLNSEIEAEIQKLVLRINQKCTQLASLPVPKFDDTTIVYNHIFTNDGPLAEKWSQLVSNCDNIKKLIVKALENKEWDESIQPFTEPLDTLKEISLKIKAQIEELAKSNPHEEIAKLEIRVAYLTDKQLLQKLMPDVEKFVFNYRWAVIAEKSISALSTNSITRKQGELFSNHVSEKYVKQFNEECQRLNAPTFVHIVQKNAKVASFRKLQVAGNVANDILSEGEQRAISIADFLTEMELNPNKTGVFFDDPVTSLDHQRRDKIAERLVELSENKQVIVFTHDVPFFFILRAYAEHKSVDYEVTTIRRMGGQVGVISPDIPWIAQKVKDRVGYLRNSLVHLKKIEGEGHEDKYLFAAKTWYGLLREGWERAVEERLFKGVIERFNPGVQTQKLKKISITPELIDEIEKGMTSSSKWVHDSAAGLNPTPPDTNAAEADLQMLDSFIKTCIPA